MLGVEFLKGSKARLLGLEYLDFQDKTFFTELTEYLNDNKEIMLSNDSNEFCVGMSNLIEKHTGLDNLLIEIVDDTNAYCDTRFFGPNDVLLDARWQEYYLEEIRGETKNTNLLKWFGENKNKVFKGRVNTTTGFYEGSFKSIPVTLTIGTGLWNMSYLKNEKDRTETIAAIILHELGHVFSHALFMQEQVFDSFVLTCAVKTASNAKDDGNYITIINDTKKILNVKEKSDSNEINKLKNNNELTVYLSTLINKKNKMRALSLGITEFNSEAYADIYAVRMGVTHQLINFVTHINKDQVKITRFWSFCFTVATIFMFFTDLILGVLFLSVILTPFVLTISALIGISYTGFNGYETIYKRCKTMLGELIRKLKYANLTIDGKNDLVKEIDKISKVVENNKPFLEDTAFSRFLGWIVSGNDFKYIQMEKYTHLVDSHEIHSTAYKISQLGRN